MINTLFAKNKSEENVKKDFKKLAGYVNYAKGHRSIGMFAADCRGGISVEYLDMIIKAKITSYPEIATLKLIADNSEGRVSFKELMLACGYSNYANNDMEQIRNINVRRGWICYVNYADRGLDSEVNGRRLALVIQNDKGNKFSSNTIVLAITSRNKRNIPTHVHIGRECGLKFESTICCELTDTVTKRRLISNNGVVEKIAECPPEIMKKVEIAYARAVGTIELHVDEQDAIETLKELNREKAKVYRYENNASLANQQVACASW